MTPEKLMESFTERTGIWIIRTTKEGILLESTVKVDAPEIIGAMVATIFGAADTTLSEFNMGTPNVVTIHNDNFRMFILPSKGDHLIAAFAKRDVEVNEAELKEIAESL